MNGPLPGGASPIPHNSLPMGMKPRGPRISITLRMALLIGLMALLVLVAGISGFWAGNRSLEQIDRMRIASNLTLKINAVQSSWIALVNVLDLSGSSRPGSEDFDALNDRLTDLNQALDALSTSVDEAAVVTNNQESRQVFLNLRSVYARADSLTNQILELAANERFDEALQTRRSNLPELQERMVDQLAQLEMDLAGEIYARNTEASQAQALAQVISGAAICLAFLLAIGVFSIGRRVIVGPLLTINDRVGRVANGDFTSSPLPARRDEIGDLSFAIERMAEKLQSASTDMERRIQERTEALERRTVQLQVAAQTARDIAAARNLTQLLENAVALIRDRFGFYHAGIFLTDVRGEYQQLRAATGEAGRAMLARGHSLRIGETGGREPTGLVGAAAYRSEPLVSSDVSQDQAHFKNPLLPETRSEAALPLQAGGRVIGVLDVQSRQPDAFDPESLNILQVMADQLAIAIQNASLLNEVQRSLADMQQAYGELERKAWLRFFQGAPKMGYLYDGNDIRPISANQPSATAEEESGSSNTETVTGAPFTLPLRVREQEIGALEVWPRQGELNSEEAYLLTALNNRLSQILESARLFEETQARAAREELINRLTAQIAKSIDLDGVLRSAATELAGIPAVREATVALLPTEPAASTRVIGKDFQDTNGGGNGHQA